MADADQRGAVLQVSADLRKLEKAFEKASGVVKSKSKDMENSATSLEKFFGKPSLAKALDKTFDATRFKILDSGVARVGIFGSALESLGPAGLAAAAGIGAVAAAFNGARQAAKFADDIADTANRLHVTTDALQEYRYAIRAAGGEEKGADEALEAFSITLGKAQEGLAKSQKPFLALRISKEQIASFKTADDALKVVVDRMRGLSDAQRDAVIQQFGLSGLKPLIQAGGDEMARLRDEAHKLGIVMDSELVKRGGALNDQFETMSKVIDVQLKSALVDLGPILLGLLGIMADMARVAGDVADAFRGIQEKTTRGLEQQLADLKAQKATGAPPPPRGIAKLAGGIPVIREVVDAVGSFKGAFDGDVDKKIAKVQAELDKRKASAAPPPIKPTTTLHDFSKGGGGSKSAPRDTTVQRTEAIAGELAGAEAKILQAMLSLTQDVEARAALQKRLVDAELAQEQARNAKQAADIEADKGLTAGKKRELVAQLAVVEAKQAEAAELQKQEIDRAAREELSRQALDLQQADLDAQEDGLRVRQSLTLSDREQAAIAVRLVQLAQRKEAAELEAVIASETASKADKALAAKKLGALNALAPGREQQAARSTPAAQAADRTAKGVIDQGNAAQTRADEYAEIDRLRQQDVLNEQQAVQAKAQINAEYHAQRLAGAQGFFGNLATLSESSNKTLSAIGRAAAITQATIDGVLAVQKALASAPPPFNFALAAGVGVAAAVNVAKIAGLKDGGWVEGAGGPRDDKVLRRLSPGEHVTNAKDAARNAALLNIINSGGDPRSVLAPKFALPSPAAANSSTRYGDAHLTYAPHINAGEPDLAALLDSQPTAMLRWLENKMRNGALKVG